MSKPTYEQMYGEDILLDSMRPYSDALLAANGELLLADGLTTANQDVALCLFIPLGGLFYDLRFGSLIHEFVQEEATLNNRMTLCAEVVNRVHADPRVVQGSASCEVREWSHEGVKLALAFTLIDVQIVRNLIIEISKPDYSLVIHDVYTGK